ncbi:hypothetical protein [Pedobacter miscanthi]|uniref:Uncharacterized protein n=1 Tax=Pedobacter miscanthi TaxID=2259170 RepID=A0A366LDB3_9SPHI|nr:hypothetical protein [Pedobacter miscanthi]RBQ11846.1 hypothetical protein DRW42_00795 [Pedobacter miscanthi]
MKTLRLFLCVTAIAGMALQGCTNPSEKGKKVKLKMTSKDTSAKKVDTLQPQKKLDPGDSVRKY